MNTTELKRASLISATRCHHAYAHIDAAIDRLNKTPRWQLRRRRQSRRWINLWHAALVRHHDDYCRYEELLHRQSIIEQLRR